MNASKLVIFLVLFTIITNSVSAYSISNPSIDNTIGTTIDWFRGTHFLQKDGGLLCNLAAEIYIPLNSTELIVRFNPQPRSYSPPITNVQFRLCHSDSPSPFYKNDSCPNEQTPTVEKTRFDRNQSRDGKDTPGDYYEFHLSFNLSNSSRGAKFVQLYVTYTQPQFTFNQSDFDVAFLSLKGMEGSGIRDMKNTIILPGHEYTPKSIPQGAIVTTWADPLSKMPVWGFEFSGIDDIIIWYTNDLMIRETELNTQNYYTKKGLVWGFILSLVLSLLFLFIERILFHWTSCGDILLSYIPLIKNRIPFIGTRGTQVIHYRDCRIVPKTYFWNRIAFKTIEEARSQGYDFCKSCGIKRAQPNEGQK